MLLAIFQHWHSKLYQAHHDVEDRMNQKIDTPVIDWLRAIIRADQIRKNKRASYHLLERFHSSCWHGPHNLRRCGRPTSDIRLNCSCWCNLEKFTIVVVVIVWSSIFSRTIAISTRHKCRVLIFLNSREVRSKVQRRKTVSDMIRKEMPFNTA